MGFALLGIYFTAQHKSVENGSINGAFGAITGEVAVGVFTGMAADKGLSKLGTVAKAAGKVDDVTLKLPNSMADELGVYQKAASEGNLLKISTKGTTSNARQVWEKANGPVPDGYDVDHVIQRQFGGAPNDISNLQLKQSSLNRSQGSKAYHLNKDKQVGTKFNKVELE